MIPQDGDTKAPSPKRGGPLPALAASIAIVLAIFLCIWLRASSSRHTQPGDPRAAFFVRSGATAAMVLVDKVRSGRTVQAGYRVAAIDVATGELLAERVFDDDLLTCWPAGGAGIWCDGDELRLLAIPQLTDVATVAELIRKAGHGDPVPRQYQEDAGGIIVLLADGRGVRVDGATLAVTDGDARKVHGTGSLDTACKTSPSVRVGPDSIEFGAGPRHPILRRPADVSGDLAPAPGAATFLSSDTPAFLEVGDPARLLVLHSKSLDAATNSTLLSQVDARLQVRWTVDVGGGCQAAALIGDELVIATSDATHRVSMIDLESGEVRWRFSFDG
jgi:hypothetical protein